MLFIVKTQNNSNGKYILDLYNLVGLIDKKQSLLDNLQVKDCCVRVCNGSNECVL